MANLKEIRNRIGSVKSTQQITKAMKMVAAAKLKKAQDAIIKIRPYTDKLNVVIKTLSSGLEDLSSNSFYQQREVSKVLIISVTGDKGLCGSFNSSIFRETNKLINSLNEEKTHHYEIDLMCIGRKGHDFFRKQDVNILEYHHDLSKNISFSDIDDIASRVLRMFEGKKYDKVTFIYNSFKNPAVYLTKVEQFLPIQPETEEVETEGAASNINYIFEPTEPEIIDSLIPMSLKINFYRNLLESNAAEHGARMTAMDKATENAQELLGDLKLFYNKERQAAITNEILEIVGGSAAV